MADEAFGTPATGTASSPAGGRRQETPIRGSSAWIAFTLLYCLLVPVGDPMLFPLLLLLDASGLVLLALWIRCAWQGPARLRRVATAFGLGAALYLLNFTDLPRRPGIYARFLWNLPTYRSVVADIERAGRDPGREAYRGHDCIVDPGPPLRVAFVWGGIIDNWVGVVYDPTGIVLEANGFLRDWSNWGDPRLAAAKSLFGGDLRSARRLFGPWYYCTFT